VFDIAVLIYFPTNKLTKTRQKIHKPVKRVICRLFQRMRRFETAFFRKEKIFRSSVCKQKGVLRSNRQLHPTARKRERVIAPVKALQSARALKRLGHIESHTRIQAPVRGQKRHLAAQHAGVEIQRHA